MGFKNFLKAKSIREYLIAKKDNAKMKEIGDRTATDVLKNAIVPAKTMSPQNIIKKTNINNNDIINTVFTNIPLEIRNLIWSYDTDIGTKISTESAEPSAISRTFPIINEPAGDLGYWPSYSEMTPAQRYQYLLWLTDIDKDIPIGYVFTFFYGLERHIFNGNILPAVKMISRLKKYHFSSKSFNSYSNRAIVYSALKLKNPNLLNLVDLNDVESSILFLSGGYLSNKLTSTNIINSATQIGWTNKRYIKMYPTKFENNLKKILQSSFNVEYFPIPNNLIIEDYPTITLNLSNISLIKEETTSSDHITKNNEEINLIFSFISYSPLTISIPDFSKSKEIQIPLLHALKEAHNKTKEQLAFERKLKNTEEPK